MSLFASSGNSKLSEQGQGGGRLVSFTVQPVGGETLAALARRLAYQCESQGVSPLHFQVFGDVRAMDSGMRAFQSTFGRIDWPVTWVEGAACADQAVAGIQVYAGSGVAEAIRDKGRVVGTVFYAGGVRQCLIGGLIPEGVDSGRRFQTAAAIDELQRLLQLAGFDLSDVVRTWFFLDEILSWYDDFNRIRSELYSKVRFQTKSLPASTGVGAKNSHGKAIALAAWAFQSRNGSKDATEVGSPMQCPAPAYGSSFSRAMELNTGEGRQLLISGTASIAPDGRTLWPEDVSRQIALTMQVVGAILQERGLTFADVTRAVAYFKHRADAPAYAKWCATSGVKSFPAVISQCAVCRDDLLFELEADAFSTSLQAD